MRERVYQFVIDDIKITVIKKRMKNIYLRIKQEDGSVQVSAPHQCSDAQIRRFVEGRIDWIKFHQKKYQEMNQKREQRPVFSEVEIKRRKALLKTAAEQLVRKWEPVMGVSVSGITIRQMKTRWGSCNVRTCHINLNLALYEKAPECLEYVVVHEMCHILEPSHNQVFWGYVTRYYPEWKQVKRRLNEIV
ncbi:MAG: M48 family metallopeptidase [Roseburia sp.]|nr:M48 family metallopeptidase [Roseburia sp.]